MVYVFGVFGIVLLLYGGNLMVDGAKRLALLSGISEVVVGLTVVAFGTSAPEAAVTMMASFQGNPGMGFGNVAGSNIANIALILGVAALVAPLTAIGILRKRDVPIMIVFTVATSLMAGYSGGLHSLHGVLLLGALGLYVYFTVTRRKAKKATSLETLRQTSPQPPLQQLRKKPLEALRPYQRSYWWNILLILGGLVGLVVGSNLIVKAARELALLCGISDVVVGLTVVAVGTSLPELVVSVVACFKGETALAIGNVVGSNIFNLGCVLGLALTFGPSGIPVEMQNLWFEVLAMIGLAIALWLMLKSQLRIDRWEGVLLLVWYALIITRSVLAELNPELCRTYTLVLLVVGLPVTGLVIGWTVITLYHHPSEARLE